MLCIPELNSPLSVLSNQFPDGSYDLREMKIRIRHVTTLPWYQPLWFFIGIRVLWPLVSMVASDLVSSPRGQ